MQFIERVREKDAHTSFRGQKHRCKSPNATDYKYYGGKGVKVIYKKEEFMDWYLIEAKKYKSNIKLSVDRINSNGNYCFENVRLIPFSENVAESNTRTKCKNVNIFSLNDELLITCESQLEAAKFIGCSKSLISEHIRSEHKSKKYNCYFRRK